MPTEHLILLGDSIFDNAPYVPEDEAVIDHLRRLLPQTERATLLAVDGHVTAGVYEQLERMPKDATRLFLSVGGNDALVAAGYIHQESATNIFNALDKIHTIIDGFQRAYRDLLKQLLTYKLPLTVCTIHDGVPDLRNGERMGLSLFNAAILKEAFALGVNVIDLRILCADADNYSPISSIEPSSLGGHRIADAILRCVHANPTPDLSVWTRV
jgi:hypothetical protein